MNGKERAALRGIAQNIEPIFHIGKNGINDNLLQDLSTALDVHELVKVAVLKNSDLKAKDCLNAVCNALHAEPICAIGNRFVIYRYSSKEGVKHIEF